MICQAGPHGALGVVFVGDGGAEEGQDGVAHQARHGAFKLVDRLDHVLEGAVHDVGPLFGVERFGGGRGAFDIAEEHGDDAPLAHHGARSPRGLELFRKLCGYQAGDRR